MALSHVPDRKDVPAKERWNAQSVYTTPEDWQRAFDSVQAQLADVSAYQGKLATNANTLADFFDLQERILTELQKLRVYSTMEYNTDALNKDAANRNSRIRTLNARAAEAFSFAEPELLELGVDTLRAWQQENARLSHIGHFVDALALLAPHTRSAEVEALLGAVAAPFGTATSAHGVLANTDFEFGDALDANEKPFAISQGTIGTLLSSPDRALRKSAFERYADVHLDAQHGLATILSAGVQQNVFMARARRYESALEASLKKDNLPLSVFYQLIDTFKANLPTWHRYWQAKKRLLNVDTFHPYDVHAPLTLNPPVVSFEQSVDWLTEALAPLGKPYTDALRRGALQDGWVDRAINKGKRMGAFSTGSKGTHPFIMMSYSDDMSGMSTLAHELGHSLHSYFAWQTQPFMYSNYSLFVAEVASNFNQAMLRAYLFEQNKQRDFQLALIQEAMANFYRYFFIMPTLARFELEIHERVERGESVSADSLNTLMRDLFAEGYGDGVRMDDARVGITWAQFHTHLYSQFYVYQYATGISGAHALANGILNGQPDAAEKYLNFLKAGGSTYPLDALQNAGVDLRTPHAVEETFSVLSGLVDKLESFL